MQILKPKHSVFLIIFFVAFLSSGCGKKSTNDKNVVVIGISSDIESLNPMYSFNITEGNISELLYLSLVQHKWDSKTGTITSLPMLAKKWEWSKDSSSVTFFLRDDVYWSDSVKTTADDFIFSLDVYSDPAAESKLYGTFKNFYTDEKDHVNIEKTCEKISPFEVKVNFKPGTNPSFFDIDFPIIPKHIFSQIPRAELPKAPENLKAISNGAFKLKSWNRNQSIILTANKNSFLYNKENVNKIIFKEIPDYNSRLVQLRKGEVDIVEDVKSEDIKNLKENSNLKIAPVQGREYDYIGWNNIDVNKYVKDKKIVQNNFFGNAKVRIALTHAINRKEILQNYLANYGQLAKGPIPSIVKTAYDSSITQYKYDPELAIKLLADEGWKDSNHDGILDKDNSDFKFTLSYPSGNPRREFAATVIKNNLKAVGIDVKLQPLELGVFIQNLYDKKFNAWMAAWVITLPLELKPYWYSDLEDNPLNFASYQNKSVDKILDQLEKKGSVNEQAKLYQQFQELIHQDEPITFLYWIDNIVAYNNKISGINVNPLGAIHNCWEWKIN